jgi:hypothetical protein
MGDFASDRVARSPGLAAAVLLRVVILANVRLALRSVDEYEEAKAPESGDRVEALAPSGLR